MILLLDNNEYRRHSILLTLFMKKYIVAEQKLDYMDFYTKPFMTVYLNPTTDQIKKIKNEDTLCIVAKNNLKIQTPPWMRVIPLDNRVAKTIMEIYDQTCPYGKGREVIGIIGIEGRKFTLGGKYIYMTKKQLNAIKILLYNPHKVFELYDISSYFDFRTDKEIGYHKMIEDMNTKCRRAGREAIIICKKDKVRISPSVAFY